ncbi:MAG: ATP-binding protein [Pseudomonadota bacterium]
MVALHNIKPMVLYRYVLYKLRHFLPKQILWRTFFILVLPIILLQTVIAVVFYRQYIDNHIDNAVKTTVSHIKYIRKIADHYPEDVASYLVDFSDYYRGYYKIVPKKSNHQKSCKLSGIMLLVDAKLRKNENKYRICKLRDSNLYRIYIPLDAKNSLRMTYHERFFLSSQWHFLPVWSLGTSVFLIFIAFIFLKNQMRPIVKLGKAARAFGHGDTSFKIHPSGSVEVRQATSAFLEMRESIRSHLEGRTLLLAGVSHDLRTILTRFALELSLMEQTDDIKALRMDVKRMEDIIESYMSFVSHNHAQDFVYVSPEDIIRNICQSFRKEEVDFTFSFAGEKKLKLRKQSLDRAVLNVIANSVRFASEIYIDVVTEKNSIKIIIEDNGPGVSENMLENIFKPFVTVQAARTQNSHATSGLGLALTKDIVHSHGGKIYAEKSEYGGLKIVMILEAVQQG